MSTSTTLIERYELHDLIGAGGSARVHLATDRLLDRRVAVKILDRAIAETADPAAHERFLREARSASRFSHPNAVATYDAGADGDVLFIVMEYVEGTSLAHVIANEAPLDDRRVTDIGIQLLSALDAAHGAGLVHRDVKPANVLVTSDGDVKLADFGIAHRFDEITSSLTAEGMVVGSRGYLPPEQARGLDTSPATDVYAVGTVLFELATGVRAAPGPPDGDVGPDPREIRPDIAANLAEAIAIAMAGNPERRFASAASMRAALAGELPPTRLLLAEPPPAPARPAAPPPARPTAVMGAARSPETVVMPAPDEPDPVRHRAGGPWWLVGIMALAMTVVGLVVWAGADDTGGITTADPTVDTAVATTAPVPTTVPVDTVPAVVPAPTTPPPTTAGPATTAPTATEELVPGFPDTDDIEQFAEQLRNGRDVAGKQAKKLADKMRDILRDDRDVDRVDQLVEEIDRWVERDELDPTVARRAVELIRAVDPGNG